MPFDQTLTWTIYNVWSECEWGISREESGQPWAIENGISALMTSSWTFMPSSFMPTRLVGPNLFRAHFDVDLISKVRSSGTAIGETLFWTWPRSTWAWVCCLLATCSDSDEEVELSLFSQIWETANACYSSQPHTHTLISLRRWLTWGLNLRRETHQWTTTILCINMILLSLEFRF